MDLGKILKKVGGAVIKDILPGGGIASLVLDAVNAFLPGDDKLPENATGDQALTAISSLPADQQAALLSKQFDVEIAEINGWSQVVESLSKADASGSSTRPEIAKMMAVVVAFAVVLATSTWAIAVLTNKGELLANLNGSWPLIVTIIGTPTALLRAYFGLRTDEKKSRYSVACGGTVPQSGMFSTMAALIKR
jgi:hypothetical protein